MKRYAWILGLAILMFAGAQVAQAENAGLGFEYGTGMTIPFTSGVGGNGLINSFVVSWSVNDNLVVGVFRDDVRIKAKREYKNENTLVTYKLSASGMESCSGIRIAAIIPGLEMMQFGIELGSAEINTAPAVLTSTDEASYPAAGAFGATAPEQLSGLNPLAGLSAKWSIINSKAKGIWTEIALTGNIRMIPVNDTKLMGDTEVNSSKLVNERSIDVVSSMNSANLLLGITIGF